MKTIIVTLKPSSLDNEVHVNDIDKVVDASIDSIRLGSVLDFIEDRDNLLQVIVSKLRYGGEIELLGTDIYDVARGLHHAELDLDDAHKLLYGNRQSTDTLQNVVHALQQLGLEVKIKRIHKYVYYVKAIRPAANS